MVTYVFIADAKTTQAPDSTLRCLLLNEKVLRTGKKKSRAKERRSRLTDFTD